MRAEATELYVYTKDHFEENLKLIHPGCVAPLIAIRQVVRRAIYQYIKDYCTPGDDPFSQDDFKTVCEKLLSEIK